MKINEIDIAKSTTFEKYARILPTVYLLFMLFVTKYNTLELSIHFKRYVHILKLSRLNPQLTHIISNPIF